MLHEDRTLLQKLRTASCSTAHETTWAASGTRLLEAYMEVIAARNRDARASKGDKSVRYQVRHCV
jgi:hypothetical protein